jgi:hypothetical protein
MKRFPLFVCLGLLLLFVTVIPVTASPEIYSVSPTTAPNNGDVTVTITGTGFNSQSTVWLTTPTESDTVYGTIVSLSPTSITCTFSFHDQTPSQYYVYVNSPFTDPFGHQYPQDVGAASNAFKTYQGSGTTIPITTTTPIYTSPTQVPAEGNIFISSFPSGANIYLDNQYIGLTPLTLKYVENGRHYVRVRLAGYQDWITDVVVYGDSTPLSAILIPATTMAPVTTTIPTTVAIARKTVSPPGIELAIFAIIGAVLLLIKRK